ncbi:MAG: hypothetical protein ACLPY2_05395 [Bryobacteraceae bacterium]
MKMTLLSCHRFRSNEVRLWLSVMAYNLWNLWRRLALPHACAAWFDGERSTAAALAEMAKATSVSANPKYCTRAGRNIITCYEF